MFDIKTLNFNRSQENTNYEEQNQLKLSQII